MKHEIALSKLLQKVNDSAWLKNGDGQERQNGAFIVEKFPKCEVFWRLFVVPYTERISTNVALNSTIYPRLEINNQIKDIGSRNYTLFMNLVYSKFYLEKSQLHNPSRSFFEDFYIHLVSACDLFEELLAKFYLLSNECRNTQVQILEKLSKDDFMKKCIKWYDKYFDKLFENYKNIGKIPPIRIIDNKFILNDLYGKSNTWQDYKDFSQSLREYRNKIIHDVQIAKLINIKGEWLVPKINRIKEYDNWSKVFDVVHNAAIVEKDFINMQIQMNHNMNKLLSMLDSLYEWPINEMANLWNERNEILQNKYNIKLID